MYKNKEVNIDWNKFKSKTNGFNLEKAKNGYIELCVMLNEVDFELVSDYINATEKVELVYRLDNNIKLYADTHTFKKQTYKTIINFKNNLKENNDEFVKFVGITKDGNLIAQVKTFDSGIVEIDMANYNSFNNARQDFYEKLKEVNGYTTDFYKGKDVKIDLFIDNVKLNPTTSNTFKRTYKNIINFKNELKENKDKFIEFIGFNDKNFFIAKIKSFDGGIVEIDMANYKKWNKSRQEFYNKLSEINGCTTDFYKNNKVKMNIYINDVKLKPINANDFKRTYKAIVNFKKQLTKNGDKFINFIKLSDRNTLISKVKTFDNGEVNIEIASYSHFNKSRQDTFNYCDSKGYKISSPYIGAMDKILIDFNCGHNPHWITPSVLKQGINCPICSESKGERVIRKYLEKNNIGFIQEYKFDDCKYKRKLPFDFYIPDYNLCIEFDGIQHFEISDFFGGEAVFKNTRKRDEIKDEYCKENNINLLRIPYYNLDSIENILDKAMS